jgi:hypothetical protein
MVAVMIMWDPAALRYSTTMRRCTPGSQVASQLLGQRLYRAHIDVALGLLVQQVALVGADHQRQRAVRQRAHQVELEALGDLLGRHAVAFVVAVNDQAQTAAVHMQLLQFLQQPGQRHQRAHALVGDDPVLLRSARQAGHEFGIGEPARVGHHHAEVLAHAFEHQQRIGLRHVAHLAQVARQRQYAQAIRGMRHGRTQQGRIEAAQIARGLGEIEIAADVQVQLAIAHRPAQIHQRHPAAQGQVAAAVRGRLGALGARGRGARAMLLLQPILHHAGQVHRQRAGAHARPRAQQQHAAARAVHAAAAGRHVQQALHHVLDFLRRHGRIDEVADPRAQRGDGAFRLAQQAHRDARDRRRDARQQTRQFGRLEQLARFVLAQGEVQEHHLRLDFGQAPAQFLDARDFLGQQAHVAQRLPELRGDAVALGTKQKPIAVLQANPLPGMCLHIAHREKPGICCPPTGPIR